MSDCANVLDSELHWGSISDDDHTELSDMLWDSHTLARHFYAAWRNNPGAHDRRHRTALQIVAGRLLLLAHDPRTCEAAWPAQAAAVAIAAAADIDLPVIVDGGRKFEVVIEPDPDEEPF